MRTELYSVRSNTDEISYIHKNARELSSMLYEKTANRVLFLTEIDSKPKKIKNDLFRTLSADNPPEFFVYLNALDTEDSSSFRRLFTPLILAMEKEFAGREDIFTDKRVGMELHVVVSPIAVGEETYPAYCFMLSNKKFLVLPRAKFINSDYSDYLVKVINLAKEIFVEKATTAPEGFIITDPACSILPGTEIKEVRDLDKTAKINLTFDDEVFKDNNDNSAVNPEISDSESKAQNTDFIENAPKEEPPANEENYSETEKESSEETKEDKPQGKFKKFIKSFIPYKGDSIKTIILKIIVLVALVVFLVGGYLLLKFYVIDPGVNTANMKEIQNIFYQPSTEVATIIDEEGNVIEVPVESKNWDGIKKINKEIVGWVKIDKTVIDYPVLEHKGDNADSQYYLYRNYKKNYSDFGSIFLDYRCTKGTDSKNVILHGHNMGSDKSMFATLTKYPGNIKYYKAAPIVQFDTPKGDGDWVIFSAMKINVSNENEAIFNYLLGEFTSDAQFMNFIYNIKERSYLDVNIPINESDQILTLSTCSYETDNMRTVIVARKLRDGEDVSKYVNAAKKKNPSSSVDSSFSVEYKAGNTKWYDGKGNLKGDESLEFMEQADMFVVKFVDSTGKTISRQQVIKGKDAEPPEGEQRKKADNKYIYKFTGWSPSYKNVQKNLVIKPTFKAYPRPTTAFPYETDPNDYLGGDTDTPTPKPPIPTNAPAPTEPEPTNATETETPNPTEAPEPTTQAGSANVQAGGEAVNITE